MGKKRNKIKKSITISDYIDVKRKARKLRCKTPKLITVLPDNFGKVKTKEQFYYSGDSYDLIEGLKKFGIKETTLERKVDRPTIAYMDPEWVGPIIFLTERLISKNPYLVTIVLNVISNYITDAIKIIHRKMKIPKTSVQKEFLAEFNIVLETRSGDYKKIYYKGPLEGIKKLEEIIMEISSKKIS